MTRQRSRRRLIELRTTPQVAEGSFTARVSAYSVPYKIGPRKSERIEPGAFSEAEQRAAFPVFYEHGWQNGPVGTGSAYERSSGLFVTGRLFISDDPFVMRLYKAMREGAVSEWSVGFLYQDVVEEVDDVGNTIVVVRKGQLVEASIVVKGASPNTSTVDLRSVKRAASLGLIDERKASFIIAHLSDPAVRAAWRDFLAAQRRPCRAR